MPDEAVTSTDAAEPGRPPATKPGPRSDRQWSGLPLAASLALVAFAVLFGIYGPRVVDRSSPSPGVPLWELADSAASEHVNRQRWAETHAEKPKSLEEAQSAAAKTLGLAVTLPDLAKFGFEPYEVRDVAVPGAARAVIVLYGRTQRMQRTFVSLLLAPDREQYVVYSPFGRPTVLPLRDVYPVTSDGGLASEDTLVWSNGSLVHILHSHDVRALDEVSAAAIGDLGLVAGPKPTAEPDRR